MAQRKYDSMQFTTKCLEFYYFTEPKPYSKYILQRKRNLKKAKWLSEDALQIAEKRREAKGKGEKERYTNSNAEFQRIARRDEKIFLSDQCKEIEETNRMGKISSRKLEIPREHLMQRWPR